MLRTAMAPVALMPEPARSSVPLSVMFPRSDSLSAFPQKLCVNCLIWKIPNLHDWRPVVEDTLVFPEGIWPTSRCEKLVVKKESKDGRVLVKLTRADTCCLVKVPLLRMDWDRSVPNWPLLLVTTDHIRLLSASPQSVYNHLGKINVFPHVRLKVIRIFHLYKLSKVSGYEGCTSSWYLPFLRLQESPSSERLSTQCWMVLNGLSRLVPSFLSSPWSVSTTKKVPPIKLIDERKSNSFILGANCKDNRQGKIGVIKNFPSLECKRCMGEYEANFEKLHIFDRF